MSPGRVIGIGAIGVVCILFLCVAAVTFLGTTAPPTSTPSTGGPGSGEPANVPAAPLLDTTSVLDGAGALTGKGWTAADDRTAAPIPTCMPAGLGDGQIGSQERTWRYHQRGQLDNGGLSVTVHQYGSGRQMAADLDRTRTETYRSCLRTESIAAYAPGVVSDSSVVTEPLPPGLVGADYQIRYRVATHGNAGEVSQMVTHEVIVLGVGRLRTVIEPIRCCYSWERDAERTVTVAVAQAITRVQSLLHPADLSPSAAGPVLSEGPDPCKLLSDVDLTRVALPSPSSSTLVHGEDGVVTCRWTSGSQQTVDLTTTLGGFEYNPTGGDPVLGVGDRAVWLADSHDLIVWINGRNFVIYVHPGDAPSAQAAAMNLAHIVLANRHPDLPT